MTLFRRTRLLSSFTVAALAAVSFWLGAAKPVAAQATPAITPGTRIFRATMIIEANLCQQEAIAQHYARIAPAYHAPYRPAASARLAGKSAPVTIVIATPPASPLERRAPTEYARIRGPEGDVRRIPLARGQDTIQPRNIIVHAGESVTLQILAAAPASKRR